MDGVIDYDAQSEAPAGKDLWTAAEYGDFVFRVEWRIKETPYTNPNVPIIRFDGTHKKGPDGKEIKIPVPDSDSGILLRGSSKSQVNIWCWPTGSGEVYGYRMDEKMPTAVRAGVTPKANADKDVGQWNAFEITMKGDRLTVVLNGVTVIENAQLPGVPAKGPIGLQHHGAEEGRRLDRPAVARPVPERLDQGAEVGRPPERGSHQRSVRSAATKPVGRSTRTVRRTSREAVAGHEPSTVAGDPITGRSCVPPASRVPSWSRASHSSAVAPQLVGRQLRRGATRDGRAEAGRRPEASRASTRRRAAPGSSAPSTPRTRAAAAGSRPRGPSRPSPS